MLRLVSSAPDFFAHAGDAPVRRGEGFGCHCARCGRTISAPFGYERKLVWCLYCGMDEGYVPAGLCRKLAIWTNKLIRYGIHAASISNCSASDGAGL